MENQSSVYTIPLSFRKLENLHILFWLLKDISWCFIWKPLGIAVIFPTLIIAIVIAFHTRKIVSELYHNVAIVLWISADSYWMVVEFLGVDAQIIMYSITYKDLAIVPFSLGILILVYYYLYLNS